MSSTLGTFIGGMPQNMLPYPPQPSPPVIFAPPPSYGDNASVSAMVVPYRIGTLPSPVVGGFSENVDPTNGRTVDQQYSPHARADLMGQGHYDLVPVPVVQSAGPGTPNTRYIALRQGMLTQIQGLQRDPIISGLQFASVLSPYKSGIGSQE